MPKFLRAKIERVGKGWSENADKLLDKVIEDYEKDVLDAVLFESTLRVPVDTGQLRDSATVDYKEKEITYASTYAVFVHEGTGLWGPSGAPYTIKPRGAKALKFIWPNAPPGAVAMLKGVSGKDWQKRVKGVKKKSIKGVSGYEFTLQRVTHPGQKPQPFLKEALEAVVPNMTGLFIKERFRLYFGEGAGKTKKFASPAPKAIK